MRKPLTKRRWAAVIITLAAICGLAILVAVSIGATSIKPWDFWTSSGTDAHVWIARILDYRLRRALLAALIGAGLATAGGAFQGILRNPLAEPYLLGVMGGGAIGAVIALSLNLPGMGSRPLAAFIGSAASMALVWGVASTGSRTGPRGQNLILAGVIVNAFFAGIIMFATSVMGSHKVKSFLFWMMGDLASERSPGWLLFVAIYIVIGMAMILPLARDYNLLTLGEDSARQLGANISRVKLITYAGACIITAACVSVAGLIGFVGLIVPHTIRLAVGPDHRLLMPACVIGGAAFLVICDTLARSVFPVSEIPIGAVTAFLGGPFFLWLLRRRGSGVFPEET